MTDETAAETPATYEQPKDGWVCFHCGERYTTWGAARDHFGPSPKSIAACKIKFGDEMGLLMALRKAEELAMLRLDALIPAWRVLKLAETKLRAYVDAGVSDEELRETVLPQVSRALDRGVIRY